MKTHSDEWFARQQARLLEPYKNTRRYNYIPAVVFVAAYFVTKDYYHGWQNLLYSFLDVSIFFRWRWEVSFIADVVLWLVALVVQIVALVFFIKTFVNVVRCKYYENVARVQAMDYLGSARVVTLTGVPGCGKTFSGGANIAIAVAASRWAKLKSDYFLQHGMVTRWKLEGNTDAIEKFAALEESYFYYAEREARYIPCLVSTIPLRDLLGRFSYVMTPEVEAQVTRVPEYSVLFKDESGLDSGASRSRDMSLAEQATYRFIRHFGDFTLINTDQRETGNAVQIRGVTDYNINLQRQETIMAPNFAWKIFQKQKNRYFRRLQEGKISREKAQYIGEKYFYREKYLETIGFRKIPYTHGGANGQGTVFDRGTYIFPRRGMADYDGRTWWKMYQAKDKPIDLATWETLLVGEDEVRARDQDDKLKRRMA